MHIKNLILPCAALGLIGFAFVPESTGGGFSIIGGPLSLAQRDFRVWNNFTDVAANDNQTPDPNFPGYFGATMAIWKGTVEWGSEAHGDGNGDPTQPGGLGSGGANFDPSFQGEATNAGTLNTNIHFEISGCSGGVLAETFLPSTDGWRIQYWQCWTWIDGPGAFAGGGNSIDLQAIATHEIGHSLGLGHSAFNSSTMFFAASGNSLPRTIEIDDSNGLKANYGTANFATKPHISTAAVNGAGTLVTIDGTNFPASGISVWFTQAGAGGTGNPIKVSGLLSSNNGTRVFSSIPANAGPGDILVQTGNSNADLSNAFPFDPDLSTCPPSTSYCTSELNSTGQAAEITSFGSTVFADNDYNLRATNMPSNVQGIFFYGQTQNSLPFGDGTLCITGQTFRLNPPVQADIFGQAIRNVDLLNPLQPAGQITGNSTWNFQFWYRDPNGPGGTGFNTTNGVSTMFCN